MRATSDHPRSFRARGSTVHPCTYNGRARRRQPRCRRGYAVRRPQTQSAHPRHVGVHTARRICTHTGDAARVVLQWAISTTATPSTTPATWCARCSTVCSPCPQTRRRAARPCRPHLRRRASRPCCAGRPAHRVRSRAQGHGDLDKGVARCWCYCSASRESAASSSAAASWRAAAPVSSISPSRVDQNVALKATVRVLRSPDRDDGTGRVMARPRRAPIDVLEVIGASAPLAGDRVGWGW
jgi:hypothetical protein